MSSQDGYGMVAEQSRPRTPTGRPPRAERQVDLGQVRAYVAAVLAVASVVAGCAGLTVTLFVAVGVVAGLLSAFGSMVLLGVLFGLGR